MTEHLWPNTAPGAQTDWISFTVEEASGEDGGMMPVEYKVNLSFMLSAWNCHFAKGTCPGILTSAANTDFGCCQMGVRISGGEDLDQVRSAIEQLTEEDWDRYLFKDYALYQVNGAEDGTHHTHVDDGVCVFANRTGGPAGKPGCAFHHLAQRTGQSHTDTKPQICWTMPFDLTEEWDDKNKLYKVTVDARNGAGWGSAYYGTEPDLAPYPAYWCTETPDAYTAPEPVYVHAEAELRKAMGDTAYTKMVELINKLGAHRRFQMPGEVTNKRRPMLPLLVRERVSMWVRDGEVDNLRRSTYLNRGSYE